MHIEKLKYYIDLYECRNFTETSRKNFVSQAALSQYISSLEKQFGMQFFDRSVTPIIPTTAGTLFYEESKILYKQYRNMVSKVTKLKEDTFPPLRIAYSSSLDVPALIPHIPAFKEKYPTAELQLNKITLKEASEYIEKGLCDIVVSFSTEFLDESYARHIILDQGSYVALVGKGNPLYEKDHITAEELYKSPLIMLSKPVIGNLYEKMIERAVQDGFEPQIEKTVDDIETEMFSIITEGYIGFAPERQNISEYGDLIKMLPIIGSSHKYVIAAGYSKDNKNPALKAFIEIL